MEQSPVIETLPQNLLVLKGALFSGQISPDKFLEEIYELDQSNPERVDTVTNCVLLSQAEIVNFFDSIPERTEFYNLRSLSYFHSAQLHAFKKESGVIEDLTQSLHDAEECGVDYNNWTKYVNATLLYHSNDVDGLRKLLAVSDTDFAGNTQLVNNLLNGLEERGYPDYIEDYEKPRG